MVAGLVIGSSVQANAVKILGPRAATDVFGKQASKATMTGVIIGKEGKGAGTKWLVKWENPVIQSSWSARSLTIKNSAEVPADISDQDSSSYDSELSEGDSNDPEVSSDAIPVDPPIVDDVTWVAKKDILSDR